MRRVEPQPDLSSSPSLSSQIAELLEQTVAGCKPNKLLLSDTTKGTGFLKMYVSLLSSGSRSLELTLLPSIQQNHRRALLQQHSQFVLPFRSILPTSFSSLADSFVSRRRPKRSLPPPSLRLPRPDRPPQPSPQGARTEDQACRDRLQVVRGRVGREVEEAARGDSEFGVVLCEFEESRRREEEEEGRETRLTFDVCFVSFRLERNF